jgi:hypothetical protein
LAKAVTGAIEDQMPSPSPAARAALDEYMQELALLGEGLSVDDFRIDRTIQARRTALLVRAIILVASVGFMYVALRTLVFESSGLASDNRPAGDSLFVAAVWALALGGLGAVANIFINVLKLIPQQTLGTSDLFEVVGRIVLGCLFSVILATTVVATELISFFQKVRSGQIPAGGMILLLPFLAGYSITLVLNLLEKAIRAIEMTVGMDDRRAFGLDEPRQPSTRKLGRRSRGG